jgi:hypothetical protein
VTGDGQDLEVVVVTIGAGRFGLEMSRVATLHPRLDADAALPSFEGLVGVAVSDAGPRRCLVLKAGGERLAVGVDGDVSIVRLPAGAIHPVPPLLAARTALRGLKALAVDPQGVIAIIDPMGAGQTSESVGQSWDRPEVLSFSAAEMA